MNFNLILKTFVCSILFFGFANEVLWAQNDYPTTTNTNVVIDGGKLYLVKPDVSHGWARGLFNRNDGNTDHLAGVGLLGQGNVIKRIFLAHGSAPWVSRQGIYILPNGNVGVGKLTPGTKLDVDGTVRIGNATIPSGNPYRLYVEKGILTEKVKVASVGSTQWADYVFEKDYDLNSTAEVDAFIKANKHLPNVPSAKEVEANGVDMVEMDATLLRQIEELWLHVIEVKKENEILKEEIEKLKQ